MKICRRAAALFLSLLMLCQLLPVAAFATGSAEYRAPSAVYSVTFGDKTYLVTEGYTISELPEPPAEEGRAFLGWYDGDTLVTAPFTPTKDVRLTAKYEEPEEGGALSERTLTASADDGSLISLTGILPEDCVLTVTDEAEAPRRMLMAKGGPDLSEMKLYTYNIQLTGTDGREYQPEDGPVTVTVRGKKFADALATGRSIRLVHEVDENNREEITGLNVNVNTVSFQVEHFSRFVFTGVYDLVDWGSDLSAGSVDVSLSGKMPNGATATALSAAPAVEEGAVLAAAEITLLNAGVEVEPASWGGKIQITMTSEELAGAIEQKSPITVYHIDDEGNQTPLANDDITINEENHTVSFEADSFSVYAVVGEIVQEYLASNGSLYEITVTYGPDAQIPEGSRLSVTEFEEGSAEYENALKAYIADKVARNEDVDLAALGFAALDISIINPDGEEIEPAAPVEVTITIKGLPGEVDLSKIKELSIQHHVETEDGVVVETVYNGGMSVRFEQNTEIFGSAVNPGSINLDDYFTPIEEIEESEPYSVVSRFITSSFSTYTIRWYYSGWKQYNIHYVDQNGNSLTPTTTPDFTHYYNFLIYDIDGYVYDSTHINSRTGTAIIPLLRTDNYNDKQYIRDNNWYDLRNDIYVVYKKKSDPTHGGTPVVDHDEKWPEDSGEPQFGKSSVNIGSGTNKISLTIKAAEKPVTKATPADVIVVFDTSGSMDEYMGNQKRLARAKTAVNTMANTLLNNNNLDVRMALISFSTGVTLTQGFTDNYNTYRNAVNGLSANGGTNWEGALSEANRMPVRSDAATFVVFITDGDPTFRYSRGNLTDSSLDMYNSGTTYQYYRQNHVFGEGSGDSDNRNFNFAVNEVASIRNQGKTFYAIGVSDDVTKVQNLVTRGGYSAGNAFLASDSAALENAFREITTAIQSTLGFGDVEINDGITSLTNTEMKVMTTVNPNSFRYYRYGGKNNKYGQNYANKQEWTTREEDGCAAASWNSATGSVQWNMGSGFQLEDGVTYVLEFEAWPSQEAFDLIADLNNGLKTYDSLPPSQKDQVIRLPNGTYKLKTNTNQISATYKKTARTGDGVTVEDEEEITADYTAGTIADISLPTETITVKKVWNNDLDGREADAIDLLVYRAGEIYLNGVSVSKPDWDSGNLYISVGLIERTGSGYGYSIKEAGHEFEVREPEDFAYHWELTSEIYRPMIIGTAPKVLIRDENASGTDGQDYFIIEGKKYKVAAEGANHLQAVNNRRSFLDMKKTVQGNNDPDELFTYKVKVSMPNTTEAVYFSAWDLDENHIVYPLEVTHATPEMENGTPTGYYNGENNTEFTIKLKKNWNLRFLNLLTGTTYSFEEVKADMPDGYAFVRADATATGMGDPAAVTGMTAAGTINVSNSQFAVTYTNRYEETSVSVRKVWDDMNNQDGIRPDHVKVQLYANNTPVAAKKVVDGTEVPYGEQTLDDDGNWAYIWQNLPKYQAGDLIAYTVDEPAVPEGYTKDVQGGQTSGFTVTNKHVPEVVECTVKKEWVDNNNPDRPTSVDVQLYTGEGENKSPVPETKDGQPYGKQILNSANQWTYTWTGLPKYENGVEIVYTMEETPVPTHYSASYVTEGTTTTITNTLSATVIIEKTFSGIAEGLIPSGFAIEYKIGDGGTVTLDAESTNLVIDGLKYTWTIPDVPRNAVMTAEEKNWVIAHYDWAGKAATSGSASEKTLSENDTKADPLTVTGSNDRISFTNTYTRQTIDLKVKKQVTGNMADRSKLFGFTAVLSGDDPGAFAGGTGYELSEDGLTATFQRSHQDGIVTLKDVPVGAVITITEDPDDYTLTGIEGITRAEGETQPEADLTAGTYSFTATSADNGKTITFTNDKSMTPDTGIRLDTIPYLLILALCALGLEALRRRRVKGGM